MRSRWVGIAALLLALSVSDTNAQQRGGVSQAERQQQISKLIEDINGPDAAARIAAFETAIAARDRTLRSVAVEQGLNSSDQVLREQSLRIAFAQKSSYLLSVEPQDPRTSEQAEASAAIGSALEIYIFNFNPETGEFLAASPFSPTSQSNGTGPYSALPGVLNGDRLSFSIRMRSDAGNVSLPRWVFMSSASGRNRYVTGCSGTLTLSGGARLLGTISCSTGQSGTIPLKASVRILN